MAEERKSYSEGQILDLSRALGRSTRTIRRWAMQGCNLDDPEEIKIFQERMEVRKPACPRGPGRQIRMPVTRDTAIGRLPSEPERYKTSQEPSGSAGNGDGLAPVGRRRGAAAALERLEAQEERAHARLEAALARGNPITIDAAQSYWLRCSESLRRLDLSVELARRDAEEQVPKRLASDVALAISDWLRISFMVWLSSESRVLMRFEDVGTFKAHAIETFRSILHMTVKSSLKTNSPIPDWAAEKLKESWNVQ